MLTSTQRSRTSGVALFISSVIAMAACASIVHAQQSMQALDDNGAPLFKVDPFWPQRLPNRWSMQQVTGIYVDHMDHIWFLNRGNGVEGDEIGGDGDPPRIDCCVRVPSSSSSIRREVSSTLGAARASMRNGRRHCRPSSWTGTTTCGLPARRRRTAS